MALRDKVWERHWRLFDSDEEIESVFLAETGPNPGLLLLSGLVHFLIKRYVIAVTDRRIVVFRAGGLSASTPQDVVASYPRNEAVTVNSEGLWMELKFGEKKYRVNRRFKAELQALGV